MYAGKLHAPCNIGKQLIFGKQYLMANIITSKTSIQCNACVIHVFVSKLLALYLTHYTPLVFLDEEQLNEADPVL